MFVTARRALAALAALAAVALVGGLAGCSGGGKPTTLPSLTANTSLSPTPTASSDQLAAVSAVVRQYFSLINSATSNKTAAGLFAIMTPECSCRRAAESVRQATANHETYFGHSTVTSLTPNLDGANQADVLVDYDYTRSGLRSRTGKVLHVAAAHTNVSLDFRLRRVAGRWLIADVQIASNGRTA